MPFDPEVADALVLLASQPSWRLDKLPEGIDLNMLRELDAAKWIEIRLWTLREKRPTPFVDPSSNPDDWEPQPHTGWFSPTRHPGAADLDKDQWETIHGRQYKPGAAPELQLTNSGHVAVAQTQRERRRDGDIPPRQSPMQAASQGDTPDEHGYVERPADPTAYVPAADILAKHTPADLPVSMKELGTIIENFHTNRVRWTRPLGKNGQPVPNRRNVHLGDWSAYLKRRADPESDGFPRLSETEFERRKAAVRDARHAGK
ncbi:MAG: hypothetical protein HZB38_02775 [Planctomycetes bacterium]|nr:hypothetical protein [Planctomycetota bacterium]